MMAVSMEVTDGVHARRILAESLRRHPNTLSNSTRSRMLRSDVITDAIVAAGKVAGYHPKNVADRLVGLVMRTGNPESAEKVARLMLTVNADDPSLFALFFERLACEGSRRPKAEVVGLAADALSVFKHDSDILMAIFRTSF